MQTICDALQITLNKNAVLGDRSALTPGGVRIGSPALTTRGFKEEDFRKVADFSKTRRGHKPGHKKRTAGESSAEEGEVSDTDSLASLNKKVKGANVGWGSGAHGM